MNKHILNRAILNRDALDDNQRKAMFARLGGGGGWKGAAKRGWDKIKQGVSEMGRLPTPEESLNKLQSDARGREALVKSALAMTPVGAGVAIGDILHGRSPSEIALASLGALPFAGGFGDDAARLAGRITLPVAVENPALKAAMREEIRRMFSADDIGGAIKAVRSTGDQARRNELAAALRRDRELKRLDQHPELFRTMMYGNRRPMTDEQRRGMFAAKAGGPNVVHSITTTPGGTTIQRTTETGFPRPAPQTGAVGGPVPDQLRRPNPMEGIAPRQGRKGPEAPAAPHPDNPPPQGTLAYKQWLKDYGKWEKTLPGAGLRPWGSSGALDQPGMGAARDRAANVKATATSLLKKAAATKKNAVQTRSRGTISRLVLPDSLRR
jgi:hypothetical protein